MPSMSSKAGLRIAYAIVLGLATLALLEVAVRALRMELGPLVAANNWPCVFEPDPETGYRYIPNASGHFIRHFEIDRTIEINSEGYHDFERKTDARPVRVLAVGDSFTAALELNLDQSWPNVAESELQRLLAQPDFEVLNIGLDGTGTNAHLALLRDALERHQPEVVMLAFSATDPGDVSRPVRYRACKDDNVLVYQDEQQRRLLERYVEREQPRGIAKWMFDHVYLFRIALWPVDSADLFRLNAPRYSSADTGITPRPDPEVTHAIDFFLRQISDLAAERDFTLMTLPIPMREGANTSIQALKDNVPEDLLVRLNVIDTAAAITQMIAADGVDYDSLYWRYDDHLNSLGYFYLGRIAAKRIAAELDPTDH